MLTRSKYIVTSLVGLATIASISGCSMPGSNDATKVANLEARVNQLQSEIDKTKAAPVTPSTTTDGTATTPSQPTPAVKNPTVPPAADTFIYIESPTNQQTVYEHPVKFVGHVSPTAQKITVRATNAGQTSVDEYTLANYKTGSSTFNYGAAPNWNNLVAGSNSYLFTAYFADGSTKSTSLTLYYAEGGAEMGKPVIYLYPTKTTEVSVNVKPTGGISISIPEIGQGWNVTATPEGQITNLADQKTYPYLFWEGYAANFKTPTEGFVVAKADVSSFFDAKLSYMGMNEKEIADFKEFWVPILGDKPYYFITFIDQPTIDQYAPLTVSPKPDTTIRVFFDYKGLDTKTTVAPQQLKAGLREGFTLIEWGGRIYR